MKRATCLSIACAVWVWIGVGAFASTVDRDGTWTPAGHHAQARPAIDRALINDGSFELGPPPASAWTEANDSSCERIGDHSGYWYVSAFDGLYDFWAGGYCLNDTTGLSAPVTASVSQTVLVPGDSPVLSFFYIAFRPDPDDVPIDGDRAYVAVDGAEVWTLPFVQDSNTYPNWVGPVMVDLCEFSGQEVTLSFGGLSFGTMTGNARFDYIEFVGSPSPVEATRWGAVKSLFR